MFQAVPPPIIRSTQLYTQLQVLSASVCIVDEMELRLKLKLHIKVVHCLHYIYIYSFIATNQTHNAYIPIVDITCGTFNVLRNLKILFVNCNRRTPYMIKSYDNYSVKFIKCSLF